MKKYDYLVFIGRFQPFHLGHKEVVDRAFSLSKNVILLIGSSNSARSTRNPFTYLERKNMIEKLYPEALILPLADHTYNDEAWIAEVQDKVKSVILNTNTPFNPNGLSDYKIGLIGCNKDHTSYYLKMFPDWDSEPVEHVNPMNATDLRSMMFEGRFGRHEVASLMPLSVVDTVIASMNKDWFYKLVAQHEYLRNYKDSYGSGPFLTADSLVQVGGKILLINRGKEYGHGLYALPGGFVGAHETFKGAALRELKEETNLRVPLPVLNGSIRASETFDAPNRSERARLVTQCYHIKLENDTKLPEVRGCDDADKADWYDISWIRQNPEKFFEDHYHIIKKMLGL